MAGALEGLFSSLEATFEAAVAREEEIAADDLAFSLSQERWLCEVAARDGRAMLLLPDGERVAVSEIGRDYLGGGRPLRVLVRRESAVVALGEQAGSWAEVTDRTVLEVLRGWTRKREYVQVSTAQLDVGGRLSVVGRDHVAVARRGGIVLIGWDDVKLIRRGREGLADVP